MFELWKVLSNLFQCFKTKGDKTMKSPQKNLRLTSGKNAGKKTFKRLFKTQTLNQYAQNKNKKKEKYYNTERRDK